MTPGSINRGTSHWVTAVVLLAGASVAFGHPGHGTQGFVGGVAHPLSGWDHLLAMIGVGMLAVGIGRQWIWALPAMFTGAMWTGDAMGVWGVGLPTWVIENGIAASVFGLGLLITLGVGVPTAFVAGLTACFGLCHGAAHGAEMPAGSSILAFFGGFTLSTVVLHLAGMGAARWLRRNAPVGIERALGAGMAACGAVMLAGLV